MSDNQPAVFLATVVFDLDGKRRSIAAVVVAVDERDAIGAATDAVRQLHPTADILGGMLEPLDDADEPNAREDTPNARGLTAPTVPASRTVH
jgi:hypothetical protein